MPMLFLVLPVAFHRQSAELLVSTQSRSGLRKFVEKFRQAAESKTDILLSLNSRAVAMRDLSMRSLQLAVARNLVALDLPTAGAFPLSVSSALAGVPTSVRPLVKASEKLGRWLAAVSLYEAALLLGMNF